MAEEEWEPLDEHKLLQGDRYYDEGISLQDTDGQGNGRGDAGSPAPSELQHQQHQPPRQGRDITRELILRALEKQGTRRRPSPHADDPNAEEKFLAAQSHLRLNGLNIGRISNLRAMQTLEVLYLYDNCISVIENVATLRRLTHLYLANNQITSISGLAGMRNLAKLYLEHNCIQVVSGLEACPALEELHISSQRLPPGTPLQFDAPSVAALGRSLRILTCAHNGITSASLPQLAGLCRLRRLDLSHNAIDAFDAIDTVVQPCAVLQNLDLRGNPIVKAPKYRDTLILMNDSLGTIDDEPVTPQQREFLLRLNIRRMKAQLAAELKEQGAAGGEAEGGGAGAGVGKGSPAAGYGQGGGVQGGHYAQGSGPGSGHGAGHGPALGVSGASSRVPPRTGGFHAGGAGGRGGLSRSGSGARGSPGLGSGPGSAAGGQRAVHGVTLGMDGMSLR